MYKNLIIGLTIIIVWGAGYYIMKSGGGELIRNAYSTDAETNLNPPTHESVAGIYSCDDKSGCAIKYTILLKEDQTLELLSSTKNDEDVFLPESDENNSQIESKSEESDTKQVERSSIIINESIPQMPDSGIVENPSIESSDTSSSTVALNSDEVKDEIMQQEYSTSVTSLNEGEDPNVSDMITKGTWGLTSNNILILTLTEQGTTTFEVPRKLIVKKVGASLLSRIDYNKNHYKDMVKPVFVRQHY